MGVCGVFGGRMTEAIGSFDIRNFSGTLRELLILRINQMGQVNSPKHFWQAQQEITRLRARLERAYRATLQKARLHQKTPPDLWMFGLAAYELLSEQGLRLDAVLALSNARLARLALELAAPIEAGWQLPLFEKTSRE